MNKSYLWIQCFCFLLLAHWGNFVDGQTVLVTVNGVVEFNQVGGGFLGNVEIGDAVQMKFELDTQNFFNSSNFPTRGYEIDQSSFVLQFDEDQIALQDPFPTNQVPYFVIRDNDPAVDGFFVSTDIDFPIGVPINQQGIFDQFENNFSVTYQGDTLNSLNVIDAVGSYRFDGLTVFNWTVDDGPFQPVGIVFDQIVISVVPEPSAGVIIAVSLLLLRRRRQSLE